MYLLKGCLLWIFSSYAKQNIAKGHEIPVWNKPIVFTIQSKSDIKKNLYKRAALFCIHLLQLGVPCVHLVQNEGLAKLLVVVHGGRGMLYPVLVHLAGAAILNFQPEYMNIYGIVLDQVHLTTKRFFHL